MAPTHRLLDPRTGCVPVLTPPRGRCRLQWYPAPTFPDLARENAKKPLYCAPPRSAPLDGVAFVAVLSSGEVNSRRAPLTHKPQN